MATVVYLPKTPTFAEQVGSALGGVAEILGRAYFEKKARERAMEEWERQQQFINEMAVELARRKAEQAHRIRQEVAKEEGLSPEAARIYSITGRYPTSQELMSYYWLAGEPEKATKLALTLRYGSPEIAEQVAGGRTLDQLLRLKSLEALEQYRQAMINLQKEARELQRKGLEFREEQAERRIAESRRKEIGNYLKQAKQAVDKGKDPSVYLEEAYRIMPDNRRTVPVYEERGASVVGLFELPKAVKTSRRIIHWRLPAGWTLGKIKDIAAEKGVSVGELLRTLIEIDREARKAGKTFSEYVLERR